MTWTEFLQLWKETNGGLLWTWKPTFEFHKIQGNVCVGCNELLKNPARCCWFVDYNYPGWDNVYTAVERKQKECRLKTSPRRTASLPTILRFIIYVIHDLRHATNRCWKWPGSAVRHGSNGRCTTDTASTMVARMVTLNHLSDIVQFNLLCEAYCNVNLLFSRLCTTV
jgi:hypothetical protein